MPADPGTGPGAVGTATPPALAGEPDDIGSPAVPDRAVAMPADELLGSGRSLAAATIGQRDAIYIRRIVAAVRWTGFAGRALLMLGAVGGVWALRALDPRLLALAVATVILIYVAVSLARPRFWLPPSLTRYLSGPMGFGGGVLQGATGMAGPVVATYVHGFRLEPPSYVFSVTAQYQLFALVQVIVFLSLGMYTPARLLESLLALVPAMLVLPVGVRLGRRLDRRRFDLSVLGVLAVMGAKLAYDALTA